MRTPALLVLTTCLLAACNRGSAPVDALPASESAAPPATTSVVPPSPVAPTPMVSEPDAPRTPEPMPEGSYADYQCVDGAQVQVHFNGIAATVTWADGRSAQLSQATPPVEGQPQAYSDRNVRIERASDGLHLREGRKAPTLCTETQSSA